MLMNQQSPEEFFKSNGTEITLKSDVQLPPAPLWISATEILANEYAAIRYVVKELIPEGVTVIAGKPKIGKSWLCLDIASAVASGTKALELLDVDQGDVLYLALEDSERRIKSRLERQLQQAAGPPRLSFITNCPRLDDGGMKLIEEWMEKSSNPRLVIIDVFARVRPQKKSSDNEYEADYRALNELHKLAAKKQLAILLVHHRRKMEAEDVFDTVTGSVGFTGAADTLLVVERGNDGSGVLHGRGRDIEEFQKALIFDTEACRWRIIGDAFEVRRSHEHQAIIDALADEPGGLSPKEVCDITDQPYGNVRQSLVRMRKSGTLEKAGRGRYKLPDNQRHNVTNTGNYLSYKA